MMHVIMIIAKAPGEVLSPYNVGSKRMLEAYDLCEVQTSVGPVLMTKIKGIRYFDLAEDAQMTEENYPGRLSTVKCTTFADCPACGSLLGATFKPATCPVDGNKLEWKDL